MRQKILLQDRFLAVVGNSYFTLLTIFFQGLILCIYRKTGSIKTQHLETSLGNREKVSTELQKLHSS